MPYNPDQYRRWQRIHARTVKLIRTNHPDLWALAQQQATIEHDATTNMEETAAA